MSTTQNEALGGRLPLLKPQRLSASQKEVYDLLNKTIIPWAEKADFQSKTDDGKLIGPFSPILFSPRISSSFLHFQEAEQKHTTLSERVRQVVILSIGAVWKSDYELYAHSAMGRKAGLSEEAIQELARGQLPDELSEQEKMAQRYVRQLSAEHRVEGDLYRAAEQAFEKQGLVDMAFLTGAYHTICALLNGVWNPDT